MADWLWAIGGALAGALTTAVIIWAWVARNWRVF